jgi:hypothetical protein
MKSLQGWNRQFDDPIPLPDGRRLVTLKSAADYVMKLPKAEQNLEGFWQNRRPFQDLLFKGLNNESLEASQPCRFMVNENLAVVPVKYGSRLG